MSWIVGGGVLGGYAANAVTFDGSTAYLSKTATLTTATDSKKLCFGLYLNPASGFSNSFYMRLFDSGLTSSVFDIYFNGSSIAVNAKNAAGANILSVTGSSLTAGMPYAILFSADLSNSSLRSFYINDSAITPTWSTYTNDTIAFYNVDTTTAKTYIGSNHGGASFYKGDQSHFLLGMDQTVDFSVQANRRKFFNVGNKPVYKGSNGSLVGFTPQIFLPNKAASFGTNAGSGGNFTINGSFSDGAHP